MSQAYSGHAGVRQIAPGKMSQIAFISGFFGGALPSGCSKTQVTNHPPLKHANKVTRNRHLHHLMCIPPVSSIQRTLKSGRLIGIVGKSVAEKQKQVETETGEAQGLFGLKPKAHWEGIGALPLFFAGFGIFALGIKLLKVKGGEWSSGPSGINKVTVPKTAITSEEQEAELHVFKCGGCGYEMYPARGREFKFFPDSFKCPLCSTPKSEFWDLNDPDDPRNQVEEDEEDYKDEQSDDDSDDDGGGENGKGFDVKSDQTRIQEDSTETGVKKTLPDDKGSSVPENKGSGTTSRSSSDSESST